MVAKFAKSRRPQKIRIRTHRAGDIGWLLQRHAVVYAKEFDDLPLFETFVAASLVPFLEHFDAKRDRLWIAELDGKPIGCVALQYDPKRRGWGKLRWFLLEEEARGLGLGRKLMARLLAFARKAGYKGIHFLTVDDLVDARRLYERTGFTMVWQGPKPCPWAPWAHEQVWEMRFLSNKTRGS